ncbi:hypothetical protein [Bacillus cereus group sp. BfR-BA-01349]|uniref:hypothetical protein n=1 Tax=Bacillus cereus group sp. BfR-BA-01349 TaxID=2920312 RepID=UPI001F58BCFC
MKKINLEYFQTGELSCPEITRLVLLTETTPSWNLLHNKEKHLPLTKSTEKTNRKYMNQMHSIIMEIIQTKEYSISKRLWLIGVFFEEISIHAKKV